jgi:signal transduction histidine kinase/HAMP domain-containing protein
MKLKYKLAVFAFFALLVPMLVISIYAGALVYRNISLAQWSFLRSVAENVERMVRQEQEDYYGKTREISENQYLRDKLYVYSKYWDKITPETLEFDLYSFRDFVANNIMFSNIESVLIFRKSGDRFIKLVGRGPIANLPETVYQDMMRLPYSSPRYSRSVDGIYLRFFQPVFSSGNIVGLVVIQKALTAGFLFTVTSRFGVEAALFAEKTFLINSLPETAGALYEILTGQPGDGRFVFNCAGKTYHAFVRPFDFGHGVTGTLALYDRSDNIVHQSSTIVRNVSMVALICLLIPVIIFVFWGSALVRSIRALLTAANVVAQGDLDHQVQAKSKDELGLLGSKFNEMVQQLKKSRTALENRNEELQLKNSYIDAVFQSLMINIIVVDATDRIVVVNRSAESRLDFPDEPVGKHLFDVEQFKGNKEQLAKVLQASRQTGEFQRLSEMQLGGDSYEVDLYPVPAEDGVTHGIVMVMINITEQMATKKALGRSEKLAAVGQIAAGLAHEINNPMGIILNHVQLIEGGKLSDAERRVFAGRVKSEIMRISKLIERLLSFSRDESSRFRFDHLSRIAADVLDFYQPGATNPSNGTVECALRKGAFLVGRWAVQFKSLTMQVCLSRNAKELPVLCDCHAVQQVLMNLLSNAFQSIHHEFGMVRIHVHSEAAGAELSVRDNGEGVPRAYMEKIFDPFFTRKRESGTGLGLPLSQKIMRNHGGTIEISSEEGRGTEVRAFFPNRETEHG